MLITIERRASCSMLARSCKHPISDSTICLLFVAIQFLSLFGAVLPRVGLFCRRFLVARFSSREPVFSPYGLSSDNMRMRLGC